MMRNKKMIRSGFGQRWFWWTLFSGLMMVLCTGCSSSNGGSGDGGDNNSNDLVNGTYRLNQFADSGGSMWNQINQLVFDGNGSLDWEIVYDSDGDTGSGSGTYEIAADGTITDPEDGIVSPDGSIFSMVDTDPTDDDTEIFLGIGVEISTGMDVSKLSGNYTMCQIRRDAGGTNTSRMSINFDGNGVTTGSIEADSGGVPPDPTITGTYTVDDNGTMGMEIEVGGVPLLKDFTGIVSPDGNIFVILDTETPNDPEVLMMVGIKKSSGMSNASLSGDYQLNLFSGDSPGASTWTLLIDGAFDGAGTASAHILAQSDDPNPTDPPDMTYTVAGDGTLVLDGITGIVAPDGDSYIIVDTDGSDGDVMLMIGIAKS
jgi:hypothetical protein